jgi:hypothetical protein
VKDLLSSHRSPVTVVGADSVLIIQEIAFFRLVGKGALGSKSLCAVNSYEGTNNRLI